MACAVTTQAAAVDFRLLLAIPETAPLLVQDEAPGVQKAWCKFVEPVMRDFNSDGDGPEPLAFYSDMATAFVAGFRAGRESARAG